VTDAASSTSGQDTVSLTTNIVQDGELTSLSIEGKANVVRAPDTVNKDRMDLTQEWMAAAMLSELEDVAPLSDLQLEHAIQATLDGQSGTLNDRRPGPSHVYETDTGYNTSAGLPGTPSRDSTYEAAM
jgi:hypothetical protein